MRARIFFFFMVSEQVYLIHERRPYGKIEKSTKALHPNIEHDYPVYLTDIEHGPSVYLTDIEHDYPVYLTDKKHDYPVYLTDIEHGPPEVVHMLPKVSSCCNKKFFPNFFLCNIAVATAGGGGIFLHK